MVDKENKREAVLLIHNLLLGTPTASRLLVERYFVPLSIGLHKQFPFMPNEALEDAAHDALVALIQSPQQYDPTRSNLLTYLARIARNKMIDLWEKSQKQTFEIFVGGSVALEQAEENNFHRGQYSDNTLLGNESEILPENIIQLINEILPNPIDRQIWDMICDGRQDIGDYAQLLEITHLAVSEQKAEVKRQRERVHKRIRRRQEEFRKRLFGEEL